MERNIDSPADLPYMKPFANRCLSMNRLAESTAATILLVLVLPLFAAAWIGLVISRVKPIFVSHGFPHTNDRKRYLAFNTSTGKFGSFLRKYSIDQLAALAGVVSGETRLSDVVSLMTKPGSGERDS